MIYKKSARSIARALGIEEKEEDAGGNADVLSFSAGPANSTVAFQEVDQQSAAITQRTLIFDIFFTLSVGKIDDRVFNFFWNFFDFFGSPRLSSIAFGSPGIPLLVFMAF